MIEKDKLKSYAKNLEFDMKDEEYTTLQKEFEILFKQMDLLGELEGISNYEPMDFPFPLEDSFLREDEPSMSLSNIDALKNAKDIQDGCVKCPKVVE